MATRLDRRLSGYAGAAGARYTRYADDLALSGGAALRTRADALVEGSIASPAARASR